jgi:hypothetical protein
MKTPAGRTVVVCPAESEGLTCAECQLCALPHRKAIIGFRSHGQSKRLVSELVLSKRENLAGEGLVSPLEGANRGAVQGPRPASRPRQPRHGLHGDAVEGSAR